MTSQWMQMSCPSNTADKSWCSQQRENGLTPQQLEQVCQLVLVTAEVYLFKLEYVGSFNYCSSSRVFINTWLHFLGCSWYEYTFKAKK